MTIRALKLADRLAVPIQPQPFEPVENRLDRGLRRALAVGVLDAQQELAAEALGVEPVEQRGARAADVQKAGRRRRETGDDLRHHATLAKESPLPAICGDRARVRGAGDWLRTLSQRRPPLQRRQDRLQHALNVAVDLMGSRSARSGNRRRPGTPRAARRDDALRSSNGSRRPPGSQSGVHNESFVPANKIGEVRSDRLLTRELEAAESPHSKPPPQKALRPVWFWRGRGPDAFPGGATRASWSSVNWTKRPPSPLPSPRLGGERDRRVRHGRSRFS